MGGNLKQKKQEASIISINALHKKAISMLKDVKAGLDKYRLTYWLDHGTLLGAVRDKKLIPWDDEIDLGAFRKDFPDIKKFCKELNKKGYIAKFAHDRIKVWKKDWKIGYINIDLHLYRFVDGHYVCDYREEKRSALSIFFRVLQMAERLFSCFDHTEKIEYCRFKNIANALLSNGIRPEDWKNIQFVKGPFGRQESFILKSPKFYIVSDPIKKLVLSPVIYKIVTGLFRLLPKALISKTHSALASLHKLRKHSSGLMKVPRGYFDDLSTMDFYGVKFKIPKKSRDYLRDIYGNNWKMPNAGWERRDMGIISR